MDDQSYLEPDFDPATLTVPRLRAILVAHAVTYPSSAKKQQLIEIFNENVAPQASKIKSASLRVKRTSRGIVDMGTGRKSSTAYDGFDDDEVGIPTTAPRSSRRTRARTEEAQDVEPTPRSTRHSTAPPEHTPYRSSSRQLRKPETIEEPEVETKTPAPRRTRPSIATPAAQTDKDDEESPFSNHNVFQSGGSTTASRSYEIDRRRTTSSGLRDVDRGQAKEVRRRTEEVRPIRTSTTGALVPSRKLYDTPARRFKQHEEEEDEYEAQGVEASEEFAPEATQDLIQAQLAGELVPTRRPARRAGGAATRGMWAVTLAMLAGLAGVWRQEKLEVGYCGVGRPSTDIAGLEIPEWADFARPQCEPCPPYAHCFERLETKCDKGFVLVQHPLSLGGLVPIPPSCEPDNAKARKINAVKERAIEELREQNARYECGEASSSEIQETKLKEAISTQRRKGMSNEEFEDLWASAIGEITKVDEVVSGSDGTGHAVLSSTSLARVPLGCAVRRSIRATLRQYVWHLVGVLLLLSSGGYGRHRLLSTRDTESRAKQLASFTLQKLSIQAALHVQDPDVYPEGFISMTQLRDDVLRDEFSAARRKKLWEKVQQKVEENANIRPMVREGRSGDVSRVWEWIGAVDRIESPPSGGERRRGGRVSFAPQDRYIENSIDDSTDALVSKRSVGKLGMWQESSPYY